MILNEYSKTAWINGASPDINKANLDNLEQGVYDVTAKARELAAYETNAAASATAASASATSAAASAAVYTDLAQDVTDLTTDFVNSEKNTLSVTIEKMFRNQTTKIVCVGDSITFGSIPSTVTQDVNNYPKLLQDRLCSNFANNAITVVNVGVPGRQTDTALAKFDTEVIALDADLAIIMFGINDARDVEVGTPDIVSIAEYKSNINGMIKKCKDSNMEVILLSPTPTLEMTQNKELLLYNDACLEVAEENNIPFINMHNKLYDLYRNGLNQVALNTDDIHFTNYNYIANIVLEKLTHKMLEVDREMVLSAYKSPFIMTDCASSNAFLNSGVSSYFIKNIGTGGTYITFSFYASIPNLDLILKTLKYIAGGIINIIIDGVGKSINLFSKDLYSYDCEVCLIKNMSVGFHKIEFLSSNLTKGNSTDPTSGNFHLQGFKFVKTKIEPTLFFDNNANQITATIEKRRKVTDGYIAYNSDLASFSGLLLNDSDQVGLIANKKLIIDYDIKSLEPNFGISYFGIKSVKAVGVNSGYSIYITTGGVISIVKFEHNNALTWLATTTISAYDFNIFHKFRVEHNYNGAIVVFLDDVQILTITDTTYFSGWFGICSNKVGKTEISRWEYAYV